VRSANPTRAALWSLPGGQTDPSIRTSEAAKGRLISKKPMRNCIRYQKAWLEREQGRQVAPCVLSWLGDGPDRGEAPESVQRRNQKILKANIYALYAFGARYGGWRDI
jgi:hypothetical protein